MSTRPSLRARMKAGFTQTFRSFSNVNFRLYELGQVVSLAGTWMQNIALSWFVYKLTGSAVALGLVSFASNLPFLLLTYVGGMAADRFNRRRLLIVTQWLSFLQTVVLTVLYLNGLLTVSLLVILSIILGCVTAIEVPTRQAFVRELVDDHELTNAIAINSSVFNSSRMFGPMLAGFIVALSGEGVCFVLNAISYLVALFTLYHLRLRKPSAATDAELVELETPSNRSLFRWLRHPSVRNVLLLIAVTSVFGFQYTVLMPVIVKQALLGDAPMLGLLSAAAGLGALVGSLTLAHQSETVNLRLVIGRASAMAGLAILVLAFSHYLVLSVVAVGFASLCISIVLSGSNSLLQTTVPAAIRGRVMGVFSLLMLGFAPIAALLAGGIAQTLGLTTALAMSAIVLLLSGVSYLTCRFNFGRKA
ncbi:MFS transporter [soil metagenome]